MQKEFGAMKRENLEEVIEECLEAIAKVMGTSTLERVRYWPLRETKYPKVRHQLFPRDKAAARWFSAAPC